MSEATDIAAEAVAEVAEEVAEQATHVAEMSRGFTGRKLGLVVGGFVVGAGLGAVGGYIFAQRRLETKYAQIAADDIAEMQRHYRDKVVALEATSEKGDLAEIVRKRGYAVEEESTEPPMAVTPPSKVVDAAKDDDDVEGLDEDDEVLNAVPEQPEERNAFQEFGDDNRAPGEWDWHKERSRRSPRRPYVIHVDEREERDAYDCVTYTYYEADDVLCNERDEVLAEDVREQVIGEPNLERFGHGSNDQNLVYIRNDQLEMDIEVVKSPNAFAQEVHGFEPEIKHSDRRRGRTSFDDE